MAYAGTSAQRRAVLRTERAKRRLPRSAHSADGEVTANAPGFCFIEVRNGVSQQLPLRNLTQIAAWVPGRWSQEHFLRYMRQHFGLDRLIEYGTQPLPETTQVVNPARRALEQQIRRERAKLQRLQAQFGAHGLAAQPTPAQLQRFVHQGGQLREAIQTQAAALDALKGQRANTPAKVQLKELPEAERFRQLQPESKHFIDTVKLIAYRAESALAGEVREHLGREDDARALLGRVFVTPANLRPD